MLQHHLFLHIVNHGLFMIFFSVFKDCQYMLQDTVELINFLESNENMETVKEMSNDEYIQILREVLKCVLAG